MPKAIVGLAALQAGALGLAVALAGCASDKVAAETWTGGNPAKLADDQAACRKDADALDVNQAANYSDGQYGVTSAMAAAVASNNPLSDQGPAIRRAAFDTCMTNRGWTLQ
jgi:hypothetical protein